MAKERKKQSVVLESIKLQSREYSEKASLLSNLLEQAESFFNTIPGKVEISTLRDGEDFYNQDILLLSKKGKVWSLLLECEIQGERNTVPVTVANLELKIKAAHLLPQLYENFLSHLQHTTSAIEISLNALRDIPFLDFDSAASGIVAIDQGGAE